MRLIDVVVSEHRGVRYQIDKNCDYTITCNGKCISNKVAACNPDPDSQGEIRYPTFEQTEKAIRSSISCWLEEPFDCIMTRGEILAASKALDNKRSLLVDIFEGHKRDDIKEIELLMLKLDGVLNRKE